jgi:hypothetical protein
MHYITEPIAFLQQAVCDNLYEVRYGLHVKRGFIQRTDRDPNWNCFNYFLCTPLYQISAKPFYKWNIGLFYAAFHSTVAVFLFGATQFCINTWSMYLGSAYSLQHTMDLFLWDILCLHKVHEGKRLREVLCLYILISEATEWISIKFGTGDLH